MPAVRDAKDADGKVGFWNVGPERPIQHPDAIMLEQATRWLPPRLHTRPWTVQEDERLKRKVMQRARVSSQTICDCLPLSQVTRASKWHSLYPAGSSERSCSKEACVPFCSKILHSQLEARVE